jgi:hypothetical protein
MPTPDEFRRKNDSERPQWHKCQNPRCPNEFEHRTRGGNKFCDACRTYHWKRDQTSRQGLHRLFGRREFLEALPATLIDAELEAWPSARWKQQGQAEERLRDLEQLLLTDGPTSARVRSKIRLEATLIIQALERLSRSAPRQEARAYELLADVGREAGENKSDIRGYALKAVTLYHSIPTRHPDRDERFYARKAGALLRISNVCRNCANIRSAYTHAAHAYEILREKCDRRDPYVKQLLHQAGIRALRILTDLRASGLEYGRHKMGLLEEQRKDVMTIAQEIDYPGSRLETPRELFGYYLLSGEVSNAEKQLDAIEIERERTTDRSVYDTPTLLRPRIEFFLKVNNVRQARRLIEEQYAGFYRSNLHEYYAGVLEAWARRPDLGPLIKSLRLPPPTYNSPILMSLPRGY